MRVLLLVVLVTMSACMPEPQTKTLAHNGCKISDYGHGVWYFDCSNDFGPALAEFRQRHKVITFAANDSVVSGAGGTSGYWVMTEE